MLNYIYAIKNTNNGKMYIGVTNNPKRRKSRHFSDLRNKRHDSLKLQNSFNKHGFSSFKFQVLLEKDCSREEIMNIEKEYISKYNSFSNGYNMNKGGLENNGFHSRFTTFDVLDILSVSEFGSAKENGMLEKIFKTSRSTIYRMRKGLSHYEDGVRYENMPVEERYNIYLVFKEKHNLDETISEMINSRPSSNIKLTKDQCFYILSVFEFNSNKRLIKYMSDILKITPTSFQSLKKRRIAYRNIINEYESMSENDRLYVYEKAMKFFKLRPHTEMCVE